MDDVVGQVEGWIDRHGVDPSTPTTCEVRSLIVSERARKCGAGAALLDALGRAAVLVAGGPTVLAAEVLEPNPAHAFYAKCGYVPVSFNLRKSTQAPSVTVRETRASPQPRDALAIAMLEAALAHRRKRLGDARFDPPRAVDAAWLGAIAAHLAERRRHMPVEIVALDPAGAVRASATLVVMTLDPPFLPVRRAALGALQRRPRARSRAAHVPRSSILGVTDRGASAAQRRSSSTDLTVRPASRFTKLRSRGARPWSRVVTRLPADARAAA